MIEVIPSINAPIFDKVRALIVKVDPYVSWCHLDVTDGVFSVHPTWRNPQDLQLLNTKLKVEVHLMIEKPEEVIDQWLVEPIRRVIVHIEATKDPEFIIWKCREAGREVGFAINPETSWVALKPWFGKIDMVQVLAVSPGPSGQAMTPDALGKVRHLRAACKACIIEIDGGVTLDTAPEAVAAGANILVAGSAIFHASDMHQAIRAFNSLYASSSRR